MEHGSKMQNRKLRGLITFFFLLGVSFVFGCAQSPPRTLVFAEETSASQLESEAVEIVRTALTDADPRIRATAAEVVANTKCIMLMPKVERLLGDGFVPVRFAAVLAVAELEYSLAIDEVKPLLNDEDRNIQMAVSYAMYKLGLSKETNVIRKAILSEDSTVRANACMLLGRIGDRENLKFLYWALRDDRSGDKVRFQAVEAIARIGDERIYPKVWTMLISVYHDDRFFGVGAMGALKTEKAKEALMTMLDDDTLEVRLSAAVQLGKLDSDAGRSVVLEVFEKKLLGGQNQQDSDRIKSLSLLAIGQIGIDELVGYLPGFLKDPSQNVRIAAAQAVFFLKAAK